MTINLNSSKSNAFKTILTSANSFENNFGITISPNPTSGIFSVKSENKIFEFEITNIIGEKVYSTQLTQSAQLTINISDKPQGIYFIRIKTAEAEIVRKIVKE